MSAPLIVYPDADVGAARILDGDLRERLGRIGEFRLYPDAPSSDADFSVRVGDAEAVMLGWGIPDIVLEAAPHLRLIAFTGVGASNHVNLPLAQSRGITVCNTPGYADQTVAEHTLALMLSVTRRIGELDADMRKGGWTQDREGFDLAGKTLGLIGLGGIGTRVAALARSFGMKVIAWTANPSPERARAAGVRFERLETVIANADILSLHLALTENTVAVLDARRLAQLRDGAVLINTARGELVDEAALVNKLQDGQLSAGLDVFAGEPLPADHPLRGLPNVVLTPHTGFNTPDAKRAIYTMAVEAIEGFFAGKPVHVVT